MTTRTEAQKTLVEIATEQFGKGKGIENSITGGLLLYIQELEDENADQAQVIDQQRDVIASVIPDGRTYQ